MTAQYQEISRLIDHALLTPTLSVDDLEAGIDLAMAYDVASVCLLPYYVPRCSERLAGSAVRVSTTIGFPHGGQSTLAKVAEAEQALKDGCQELDVVVNISRVISGRWQEVTGELAEIVGLAHDRHQRVKVIFENCYLQDEQKQRLCEICGELNADWVKTSTGFGTGGATEHDVKLMREASPEHVQVKAAGGIRDLETLLKMRELGATRIGTSRTAAILDQWRKQLKLPPLGGPGLEQHASGY